MDLQRKWSFKCFCFSNISKKLVLAIDLNPKMMLCILINGYFNGIHSSRKIEEALYYHVGFRFLTNNNFPTYKAINNF